MNQSDVKAEIEFDRRLSFRTRYFRFGSDDTKPHEEELKQICLGDECPCRCFVAEVEEQEGVTAVAFGRFTMGADRDCEMSIVVADEWQRQGLGQHMTKALIAGAKACGMRRMYVSVLASNARMLNLAKRCGFLELPDTAEVPIRALCLILEGCPEEDLFDTSSVCPEAGATLSA